MADLSKVLGGPWSPPPEKRIAPPEEQLIDAIRAAGRTSTSMPLGAQQLKRQRTSTLLSLGGVTAALLVIFAQLGIERAVYESSVRLHRMVSGDLIIVPYG